jgi:hypothetical protein
MKNTIIGIALAGALVIAPMAVFANNDKSDLDRGGVRSVGSELSIQINDNGKALVRGAKVTGVSGTTITAATMLGSTTLTWSVVTNGSTTFVDKGGRNVGLAGVTVGDILSFNGSLDATAASLTVNATSVKDWSKNTKILEKHVFEGKLQSTIGTTTLPATFGLAVGGTNYTVNVAVNTPILAKNWATTNLGTFISGDIVRVYGAVEAANLTTIDAVVVRDSSR